MESKWAMIIDSHVHLKHGDAQRTEYGAETIARTMDAVGIEQSVVFAMSTTTRHSIKMASQVVSEFPDRLVPCVYALPSYERAVLGELDHAISNLGFRGIKIHAGECTLAEYVVDPVIELAGRRGVPCLVDFGGRYHAAERLARGFPNTRIVVAHMGKHLSNDQALIDSFIRLAVEHDNLFLDVSGVILVDRIRDAVGSVSSARVVFGTDGPHEAPDTVGFARAELGKIRALGLSPDDEAAILGGSIAKLWTNESG